MNIYDSITLFYDYVFNNQDKKLKHRHISFMLWLIHRWYKNGCPEWFYATRSANMIGSGILNRTYYYNVINDLVGLGLISNREGINNNSPPMFRIDYFIDVEKEASFDEIKISIINDKKLCAFITSKNGWTEEETTAYITEFMERCEITGDNARSGTEYKKHLINKALKHVKQDTCNSTDEDKFKYLFDDEQ